MYVATATSFYYHVLYLQENFHFLATGDETSNYLTLLWYQTVTIPALLIKTYMYVGSLFISKLALYACLVVSYLFS